MKIIKWITDFWAKALPHLVNMMYKLILKELLKLILEFLSS